LEFLRPGDGQHPFRRDLTGVNMVERNAFGRVLPRKRLEDRYETGTVRVRQLKEVDGLPNGIGPDGHHAPPAPLAHGRKKMLQEFEGRQHQSPMGHLPIAATEGECVCVGGRSAGVGDIDFDWTQVTLDIGKQLGDRVQVIGIEDIAALPKRLGGYLDPG
jgi:hypothetical protein